MMIIMILLLMKWKNEMKMIIINDINDNGNDIISNDMIMIMIMILLLILMNVLMCVKWLMILMMMNE